MRNTLLREHLVDHAVELSGACQVVAERLLDHHPAPSAALRVASPDCFSCLHTTGNALGGIDR